MTKTIHWLGAGLSSAPGILRLNKGQTKLTVWNRRIEKAKAILNDDTVDVQALEWEALSTAVQAGDVVVSMLPATMHVKVASLCLEKGAHFVSSSYISPEMSALNESAEAKGLSFVNEVGLDPGIDHLFAHDLVHKYRESGAFDEENELYFTSYCGGFPKVANDFKYKFSWSPLGVLKALKSPAKWLAQGQEKTSQAPWEALSEYTVSHQGKQETFQAYPNRDSIPFISQYEFEKQWNVKEFVRGTLRLSGWSTAWQYLFDQVAEITESSLSEQEKENQLAQVSQQLEEKYSYDDGEPDRVVLAVELTAKKGEEVVWKHSYFMDEAGNKNDQAMARLVSLPVSIAIEAVISGDMPSGVSAAPHVNEQVQDWLNQLTNLGEKFSLRNHL